MKVHFVCGYYSDLAHRNKKRPEKYWDAYFYVWGVKVGTYRRSFNIHYKDSVLPITPHNFNRVRSSFGRYVEIVLIDQNIPLDVVIIPVPSKDGLLKAPSFRARDMAIEAMAGTLYADNVRGALRWSDALLKAHEGGDRRRSFLLDHLVADPSLKGRSVVLIDDLLSTGGSMLAARDCLQAVGANVLSAVTCGRTIYDFDTKAFGRQEIDLTEELGDFAKTISR